MCVCTRLFHIVHPDVAAIVHSSLGQARSIAVRGLRRYSTFSSAEVHCRAYYSKKVKVAHTRLPSVGADPGSWQSACR